MGGRRVDVRAARAGSARPSELPARLGRVVGRGGAIGRGCRGPGPVGAWFRARDLQGAGAQSRSGAGGGTRRPTGRERMTAARDEVLGRIRGGARRPAVRRPCRAALMSDTTLAADVGRGRAVRERVADYRATVRRASNVTFAAAIADGGRRPAGCAGGRPAGFPGAWLPRGPDGRGGRRRSAAVARRPRRARRRRDRLRGRASPRPARSSSTRGRTRAVASLSLLPDLHVCVVRGRPDRRHRPRGARPARRPAAADLDQRPVGDQRHRAPAGRGRPRPATPRRRDRRGLAGSIRCPARWRRGSGPDTSGRSARLAPDRMDITAAERAHMAESIERGHRSPLLGCSFAA